jgi:hypothetical protein
MRSAFVSTAAALLFTACVAPTPGAIKPGPDPVNARYINPGTLAALPGFTHAVKIGATVYANLSTVLRIAGTTPADVAKLTIYVVNAKPGDLDVIHAAAPDFFPLRNPPAGTVVGVQTLPREGLLIAVDATAVVRALVLPLEERERYRRP